MSKNHFPQFFLWGGSFSANQAEGGYKSAGKGVSQTDLIPLNKSSKITSSFELNNCLADENNYFPRRTGIDFFNRFDEDLALISELGINSLRISIAWSRIFPNGDETTPNEQGLAFYKKVIDKLSLLGIEPVITISHYEMPVKLITNYGGWKNRKLIDFYTNYVQTLLHAFPEVKYWLTFNQINSGLTDPFSALGLLIDDYVSKELFQHDKFQAMHHQLVATAKVKQIAQQMNSSVLIGASVYDMTSYPRSPEPNDVLSNQESILISDFCSDVLVRGRYSKFILNYFKKNGVDLDITAEDQRLLLHNTIDFLGISYYVTTVVDQSTPSLFEINDWNIRDETSNKHLKATKWGWGIDPVGLRIALRRYTDKYPSMPIMILENGLGAEETLSSKKKIHDSYRIDYLRKHLSQLQLSIQEGVNVIGYFYWSPIDIVSSGSGQMHKRYGLIYVDLNDFGIGSGKRIKKDSFYWYKQYIE